jgi:transcriptional regulator with GAF, ATPase, and Fis domain
MRAVDGMSLTERENALTRAFVDLADTLVSDFDVADLLHSLVKHCVTLLDADAAGLLLSDQRGGLQVLASSSEQARLLELFQLQADEGPCLHCFRTGAAVSVPDLSVGSDRWPRFAGAASTAGYASVHALPLRLRSEIIGALNLFGTKPGSLPQGDLDVAQALADVATIGILQERAIHNREVVVEQLQGALNSRVVIEQAKGLLAEAGSIDMDAAFTALRQTARRTNSLLAQVARDLVDGKLEPRVVLGSQTLRKT